MEHILNSRSPGIDFTSYLSYVESIQDRLPPHIYVFASDPRHFDLSSPSSLHDAWLETLSVREVATGMRNEIRKTEISLTLLGPAHDRRIHLSYTGVTGYSFTMPFQSVAHGDLLTHEIRLGVGKSYIHEIQFQNESTLLIEYGDMKHTEEINQNQT